MKKLFIILISIPVLIFCIFFIRNIFIDKSAVSHGEGIIWNGVQYQPADGYYTTPKNADFLAEDQKGASIYGFGDDPEHTYVEKTSFLDNYLLVRADYQKKDKGEITAISVKNNHIELTEKRKEIKKILYTSLASKPYLCTLISNNDLMKIEFSYNKSHVTDNFFGYISFSNQAWYYIPKLSASEFKNLYNGKKQTLRCYRIDSKYKKLFDEIPYIYNWFNDPDSPHFVSVKPIKS